MNDTVFRTRIVEPAAQDTPQAPKGDGMEPVKETTVEPPFMDYEKMKGQPFLVDHYELGALWNRGDMYSEAFIPEVTAINKYLDYAISKGDVNNTTESVKKELNRIEKMINVRPDQRKTMRIGLVAEYVKFLMKSDYVKKESAKYGMI